MSPLEFETTRVDCTFFFGLEVLIVFLFLHQKHVCLFVCLFVLFGLYVCSFYSGFTSLSTLFQSDEFSIMYLPRIFAHLTLYLVLLIKFIPVNVSKLAG